VDKEKKRKRRKRRKRYERWTYMILDTDLKIPAYYF